MQEAMTPTGLALGFYGGIAVFGFVYQVLFMPETKGLTLEEVDLCVLPSPPPRMAHADARVRSVFQRPTRDIVAENWRNSVSVARDLVAFRWGKIWREASAPRVRPAPGAPLAAAAEKDAQNDGASD
jgi:hypothetical protein